MAGRVLPVGFCVRDALGNAYSGAKCYTRIPGTATNKATYTTSALSVANTAVLTADAFGVFGDAWAATGQLFDILVTQADGSSIDGGSWPNVEAVASDTAGVISRDFGSAGRLQIYASGGVAQLEGGDPSPDSVGGQVRIGGWNGTQADSITLDAASVIITGSLSAQRSYLAGLTLSAAGSTATFGVAAGVAMNSTNTALVALSSAVTKTTSAWAVGSGNGGLDTGAIANSTWYYAYLIQRPDTAVVDVLVSLSATSPTLPASYTLFRRIGSMLTSGAGQWAAFTQIGDRFLWTTGVADVAAVSLGTTATLYTLSVPPISSVAAIINATGVNTNGWQVVVNSPLQAVVVAGTGNATLSNLGNGTSSGQLLIDTNSSGQVRAVTNVATTTFSINTIGWIDRLGRDA